MPKFLNDLEIQQNQLITPVVHNAASAPTVGEERDGQLYYDTTSKILFYWSVDRWVSVTGEDAYQETVGGDSSITVTHGLGTTAVNVQLYALPSLLRVDTDVTITGMDSIRLDFGSTPAVDSVHVIVFS